MARTGPRRNQYTGPACPQTPPDQLHPLDPVDRPAKRRKLDQSYIHYKTPQKTLVQAIVAWEDTKDKEDRAIRKEIFEHCKVSRTQGFEIIKDLYAKPGNPDLINLSTVHSCRHYNNVTIKEACRAKQLITKRDICWYKRII